MGMIRMTETETVHHFDVEGFEPIRDNQRSPFVPDHVEVWVRATRLGFIRVSGRRVKSNRPTETGFPVTIDGTVEQGRDAPPDWLTEIAYAAGYGQR